MIASQSHSPFFWLKVIQELTKVRITAVVTVSVATGYLLFMETLNTEVILPALGVFLLACGSAAMNQVQEAGLDARMPRTRNRPIPSGRIPREWALFISLLFIGAGFYLISCIDTHTLILLGLAGLAVVWYNGVYVLLKKVTPFAVVPGAIVGAIPPMIGWASAGGIITDPTILWVAFFFFIWQIPHFWLLLLMYGKDYEEAQLPSLTRTFSKPQIARITCMWILSVAVTGLLLGIVGKTQVPWNVAILVISIWLSFEAFGFLQAKKNKAYFHAFMRINVYALLLMLCLVGNALW